MAEQKNRVKEALKMSEYQYLLSFGMFGNKVSQSQALTVFHFFSLFESVKSHFGASKCYNGETETTCLV